MDLNIKTKNCDICRVYSTKFLGVHINSKLNWKQHVNNINTKLSKCIGILIKARMYLPKSSLLTLYCTFAYPYFLYCIHVWGRTYQSYSKILEVTQKKLIRLLTFSEYRAHTKKLFKDKKVLTVSEIYVYAVGLFMYGYYKTELPCVFNNMFRLNRTVHNYGTRQKDLYDILSYRLDIVKNSIRYRGVIVWNQIMSRNDNLPLNCSIHSFQFHLRWCITSGILPTNAPGE